MKLTTDLRPDPDALLLKTRAAERGRLKVFLGAAPGVGKTFAMLSAAGRLARAQVDVVVGLVETHGRAETEALLAGLETLPRRSLLYRGTTIQEFDIDAALARRPALLIVDELAHTNAPESRHPKRYQDVEELLRAGIDVWTAVNIQHLEGLSDVVSRITGVTVRETIPDTLIERADEVVVVDVTPAELITRLGEGRIYLPENAARAADGFFKPGNLTALRELALRRTADRVDDQMIDHLRANAIEGAWPTAERLLVCVGPDMSSERVLRDASRLAHGLNAPWTVVTLEQVGREITDDAALRRIDDAFDLAERLGAETLRLAGRDLVEEIMGHARRNNITAIVIGRSRAGLWSRLRGLSLSDALLRRASDIAVHVVVGEGTGRDTGRVPRGGAGVDGRNRTLSAVASGLGAAILAVAAAVGAGLLLTRFVPLPNIAMLFLTAVLVCAVTLGVWAAIAAAVLSFLSYNFFFIPPVYTFTVAEPHELLSLVIFLMVAVLTGGLAGRVREQSDAARKRIATIQTLYDLSRKLSGATKLDDVLWVLVRQAAEAIKGQVLILLPGDETAAPGDLAIRAAFPPEDALAPGEEAAARWAFEKGEAAGWRTATLPNARLRFLPIRTPRATLGVIGFEPADHAHNIPAEDERTVSALLEQGAISLERALLVVEARRSEALAERERLQSTLLSSLSHDLRTPLSSILGAVTSLRAYGDRMEASGRDDLLSAAEEEAVRLSRFVSNLLDMTRVESGALDLRDGWIDVEEVAAGAADRARKAFRGRTVALDITPDLPLVRGDAVLFEQVLFNILDNADKYGDPGTPTRVDVRVSPEGILEVATEDRGLGIASADLARIFGKFTRLEPGDGRPAGTGLGLAIAKGVVDAMGGTIHAESPAAAGRGTRIVIRVPVPDREADTSSARTMES